MIFITAKFPVKPEHADAWLEFSREFSEKTNAEEGCLFFEWGRSLADPDTYILIEAFHDDDAGSEHVQSEHFQKATAELPAYLARTPDIVNVKVDGWSKLGELAVE